MISDAAATPVTASAFNIFIIVWSNFTPMFGRARSTAGFCIEEVRRLIRPRFNKGIVSNALVGRVAAVGFRAAASKRMAVSLEIERGRARAVQG